MDLETVNHISVMRKSIMFLRICFLFPTEEEIVTEKGNVYLKFTMMSIFCSYYPIGMILHLMKNIKDGQTNYIDEDLMTLLAYLGVTYFTFRYFMNIKELAVICQKLSDFQTFGKPANFDDVNKFLDNYSIFFYIYHTIIITMIACTKLTRKNACLEENEKNDINEICGMIGRMWLPFDYDYTPLKQILLAYQYFATLLVYHYAGVVSYVMYETTAHVITRFQHLIETFENIVKCNDPFERKEQFKKAVQYHYALIRLGSMANTALGPCCLVHLILTGPVLGTSGYRLVTATTIDSICVTFSWTVSTTLACTAGQQLKDWSSRLSEDFYQTDWYKLDKELQRDAVLVILRARHPNLLKAGPFGAMSFETLLMIAKTSYSYLALLQSTI